MNTLAHCIEIFVAYLANNLGFQKNAFCSLILVEVYRVNIECVYIAYICVYISVENVNIYSDKHLIITPAIYCNDNFDLVNTVKCTFCSTVTSVISTIRTVIICLTNISFGLGATSNHPNHSKYECNSSAIRLS